jgi:hypothetical protein
MPTTLATRMRAGGMRDDARVAGAGGSVRLERAACERFFLDTKR